MSTQELVHVVTTVAAYDPFRAQLAELKEGNSKAVFDYRDAKGNKEARSHVYKLRQTKAAVDKVRKAEKESSLNYGRLVDSQAKEIVQEIEDMIEVHEKPIREIEQEEAARIESHRRKISEISMYIGEPFSGTKSFELESIIAIHKLHIPDESYQEFMAEAMSAWKSVNEHLNRTLELRLTYEAEQVELERLRKEAAEREKKEREERIAKEAADKATKDAQDAAAKLILDAQLAKERADNEKLQAEAREKQAKIDADARELKLKQDAELATKLAADKAERDQIQAIEDERARAAAETKRLADIKAAEELAAQKLAANQNHRKAINKEVIDDLINLGCTKELAITIVTAMMNKDIRNAQINY